MWWEKQNQNEINKSFSRAEMTKSAHNGGGLRIRLNGRHAGQMITKIFLGRMKDAQLMLKQLPFEFLWHLLWRYCTTNNRTQRYLEIVVERHLTKESWKTCKKRQPSDFVPDKLSRDSGITVLQANYTAVISCGWNRITCIGWKVRYFENCWKWGRWEEWERWAAMALYNCNDVDAKVDYEGDERWEMEGVALRKEQQWTELFNFLIEREKRRACWPGPIALLLDKFAFKSKNAAPSP